MRPEDLVESDGKCICTVTRSLPEYHHPHFNYHADSGLDRKETFLADECIRRELTESLGPLLLDGRKRQVEFLGIGDWSLEHTGGRERIRRGTVIVSIADPKDAFVGEYVPSETLRAYASPKTILSVLSPDDDRLEYAELEHREFELVRFRDDAVKKEVTLWRRFK